MHKGYVALYQTKPVGYMLPAAKRREANGVLEPAGTAMWRGLWERAGITKSHFSFFHQEWRPESIGQWVPPHQSAIVFEVFAIDIPATEPRWALRAPANSNTDEDATVNGARWYPIRKVLRLDVQSHARCVKFAT